MKDRPVPRDEMPLLPIRHRDGDHAGAPQFDELLGAGAAPMSDDGWQRVSEVFGSAAADPTASELTVDSAALTAFRRAHLGVPTRRHLVRSNVISTLLSSKIAGAIACAAIGVTGAAGAAYANVLPRPIQDIAHNTIGAPPTHGDLGRHGVSHNDDGVVVASPSVSPTVSQTASPSASASALAARLCDEWSDVAERSTDDNATNVHDQLAVLAGGAGNITAFCATVGDRDNDEHHSASPSPTASPSATTSTGDDQRDDQGDDHGRDGASASPTQGSNRGQSPSPSASRTDNSGPGNNNGSDDNSGPGNNDGHNDGSTNNDGRGGNDGSGNGNDG